MEKGSDPKAFGRRLKELRKAAGLNQVQLAEKAGLSAGGLAHLEQGLWAPSWETVVALSDALGTSCESFKQPPQADETPSRGRPTKTVPVEARPSAAGEKPKPKRGHGRPRKKRTGGSQ